jgi:hypothetical protein
MNPGTDLGGARASLRHAPAAVKIRTALDGPRQRGLHDLQATARPVHCRGGGRRIFCEGVGFFCLADGLNKSYEDYARAGEVLVQLGLPDGKTIRVL